MIRVTMRRTAALVVAVGGWMSTSAAAELPRRVGADGATLAVERIEGTEVRLDHVDTPEGYRLRTVVTRPEAADGPRPGLFLVGWLSCDSVENPEPHPRDGFLRVLHELAGRSGWVIGRVDKPGVGDSEGPDCSECDFRHELEGYRAAFQWFRRQPEVDPARVHVIGMSSGGGYAPLVAGTDAAGYIVSGGWAKTWYEHMIEHERRRLALSGRTPGEVNDAMRAFSRFYHEFLNERRTPEEIVAVDEELSALWYEDPKGQYGRPAVYYQQKQEANLAEAWSRVDVPTLVLYGEFDWIMSRADHEWIVEIVNARHPGIAELATFPGMGHDYFVYANEADAFRWANPIRFEEGVVERILGWLRKVEPSVGS